MPTSPAGGAADADGAVAGQSGAAPAGRAAGERHMAGRFEDWAKRNIALTVLTFAAVLISSVITLFTTAGDLKDWYESRFEWKEVEYEKLASLHAGYSFAKFREELGAPLFTEPVKERKGLTENIFEGRGYWVDVVTDRGGTALSYAVTSCESDFRPTFSFGIGQDDMNVTLNRDFMAKDSVRDIGMLKVFVSGATANSYAFQIIPASNPTNYKSYGWGVNDACSWRSQRSSDMLDSWLKWQDDHLSSEPYLQMDDLSGALRGLMGNSIVNTYMETAPHVLESDVYPWQVGVDRILTRTVSQP
ncbi:ETEC_3214 domain-containing protein [Streptomyces sp. NPDC001177]